MSGKTKKPKKFKPTQSKLPGFTDKEQEEIEGVLEYYKTTEEKAKSRMKKVNDQEEARISKAALEVIKVMQKFNRKTVTVGGLLGQLLSVVKVKVKRQKGATKTKPASDKPKASAPKKEPAAPAAPPAAPPSAAAAH